MKNRELIITEIRERQKTISSLNAPPFLDALSLADRLVKIIASRDKKILVFGDGGSAIDDRHIAEEFTWCYVKERRGFPAIALTSDIQRINAH